MEGHNTRVPDRRDQYTQWYAGSGVRTIGTTDGWCQTWSDAPQLYELVTHTNSLTCISGKYV